MTSDLSTSIENITSLTNSGKDCCKPGSADMTRQLSKKFNVGQQEPSTTKRNSYQDKQKYPSLHEYGDSSQTNEFTFPEDDIQEDSNMEMLGNYTKPFLPVGCPICRYKSQDKGQVMEHFVNNHPCLPPPPAFAFCIPSDEEDQDSRRNLARERATHLSHQDSLGSLLPKYPAINGLPQKKKVTREKTQKKSKPKLKANATTR